MRDGTPFKLKPLTFDQRAYLRSLTTAVPAKFRHALYDGLGYSIGLLPLVLIASWVF